MEKPRPPGRSGVTFGVAGAPETQAALFGCSPAATETFLIGPHARPFVIPKPLLVKSPQPGDISIMLAMACVPLRNRSAEASRSPSPLRCR